MRFRQAQPQGMSGKCPKKGSQVPFRGNRQSRAGGISLPTSCRKWHKR